MSSQLLNESQGLDAHYTMSFMIERTIHALPSCLQKLYFPYSGEELKVQQEVSNIHDNLETHHRNLNKLSLLIKEVGGYGRVYI